MVRLFHLLSQTPYNVAGSYTIALGSGLWSLHVIINAHMVDELCTHVEVR